IAKNAKPLALVAAAQKYPDPYNQAPKSHKSYAPPSKQSSSTRSHASTRYTGKEIAKPITPPSESASSEEDKDRDCVAEAKETVGSQEKMLLCKQTEKGVPLQAEQTDWLKDTDEEIDEQELEAHYSYMAKIQEVPTTNSGTDTEPFEKDYQNAEECDNERVVLANLKLDIDESKKDLKKAKASLAHELNECKPLKETCRTLR
nr:hypothetical protein [Tanacetum cinerariifolium]